MPRPTCFVLDSETHRMIYKADSLAQATGYVDRRKRPSIIALSAASSRSEFAYRLAMVDGTTGQVVASGPIISLFDAVEALCDLKIVLLPCSDAEARNGVEL